MANLKSIFEIPTRPCWVDGRRAIFHRWTDSARPVKARGVEDTEETPRYQLHSVHALVEYEDGTMERVWPNAVRFADSDALFAGYDWEGMEHRRDELPYTYDEPGKTDRNCLTCAHETDNVDFCRAAEMNCEKCTVIDCVCKRCHAKSNWEPKAGAAV